MALPSGSCLLSDPDILCERRAVASRRQGGRAQTALWLRQGNSVFAAAAGGNAPFGSWRIPTAPEIVPTTLIKHCPKTGPTFPGNGVRARADRGFQRHRQARRKEGTISEQAPDRTTDAIRRASAGDAEGLAYLYRRYAPGVYGYVRQIVSNDQDAEDVTQQVFLKLVTRLGMYESKRAPFSAWMLRVARNTAIDHLRQRRFTLLDEDYEWEPEDAHGDPDAGRSLREALEGLTQTQRDVLLLREVAGLTPTEVAERLGKTQGAVNTCYHRACLAARSTLESMGSAPLTFRTRNGA